MDQRTHPSIQNWDWFFVSELAPRGEVVYLSHTESHHAKHVLRKQRYEQIWLTDGRGRVARARLEDLSGKQLSCRIEELSQWPPPFSRRLQVALAMIRPTRLDWAVEKLTELGVGSIVLLKTRFTQPHPFKEAHLRNVSVAALKQSRQAYLPRLTRPQALENWLDQQRAGEAFRYVGSLAGRVLSGQQFEEAALSAAPLWLLIGPEGGFSAQEWDLIRQHAFREVRFSRNVLRSETAAVVGAARFIGGIEAVLEEVH